MPGLGDPHRGLTDLGPLAGVRLVEIGGIGPGPFAAMVLADMGAEIVRVHDPKRDALLGPGAAKITNAGRTPLPLDIKVPEGRELVLRLTEAADGLIEGLRPGVMERLGLGPDDVLARNARLVYGRITGYGQDGPLSRVAGHDINYISICGALGAIAREGERPLFPLNLLGDYGGGGMLLAFGMVCGLLEARSSGKGQVVDSAMVDGVALLTTAIHGLAASGTWGDPPGTNVLDSGAHFYEVYETSDGGHIAVGAIEPQFYAELLRLLEIDPAEAPQWDRSRWPELKQRFARVFAMRTRAEWTEILESADACATPVLSLREAQEHHHNLERQAFVEVDDVRRPAAAPRFSRTPGTAGPAAPDPVEALARWGLGDDALELFGSASLVAA